VGAVTGEEFVARVREATGHEGTESGDGWRLRCPAHHDETPSLQVSRGGAGRTLVHCHAGCTVLEIMAELKLSLDDLFGGRKVYSYVDGFDQVLFQVIRKADKGFWQRRPDGRGGWVNNRKGVPAVLYRWPEVRKAREAGRVVWVAEGEKDADALVLAGVTATCNPGGAGKWRQEFAEELAGIDVVIVADRDGAGYAHAAEVAATLEGKARSVRVVEAATPGPFGDGADAYDHLDAGLGLDAFRPVDVRARAHVDPLMWPPGPLGSSEGGPGGQGVKGFAIRSRRLAAVTRRDVEWLWQDRIPLGKLTLLVGDPGAGKSYMHLALAAPMTRGQALPLTAAAEPASVAIFQAEDDPEDTLAPRADLLGMDDERVLLVEEFTERGKRVPFGPEHVPALERALDGMDRPRLLVIDPVASFVGGKVDTYRDNQVREALAPLVELAQRRRMAVLAVVHMNKDAAKKALYRAAGSVAFVGLVRSVLLAAKDEQTGRRAVVAIKHNLTADSMPLEYDIGPGGFAWLGEAPELTAERLLSAPLSEGERTALQDAKALVVDLLSAGARRSKELEEAAGVQGITAQTLKRARKALGVVAEQRQTGPGGRAEWWGAVTGPR
jgi:putative DNA primase/helicase